MNSYLKVEVRSGMFSHERIVAFEDLTVGRRTLMLDATSLVGDKLPVSIVTRAEGRVLVRLPLCSDNCGSPFAEVRQRDLCEYSVN